MNDIKSVWKGMDVMSGRKKKSCNIDDSSMTYVNNLNSFYCRFDCHDFEKERKECKQGLAINYAVDGRVITIQPNEVKNYFEKLKTNKAPGPDGLKPLALKTCALQLCQIFCDIFNLSLAKCKIPKLWKTTCISPVPKKQHVATLNDLRPIALTSCVMEVFEKNVLSKLRVQVQTFMDPFQFAYSQKRGVDDAVLCLLNPIYKHLETKGSSVRIMFYDFSSAFNTIQPHLLAKKLTKMDVFPSVIL